MAQSDASSTSSSAAAPAGRPVVRVNGAILTDRDLVREMLNVFPYAKQHGGKLPKDAEPEIRKTAMRNLEFEELAYQEAKRRNLAVTGGTGRGLAHIRAKACPGLDPGQTPVRRREYAPML